MRIQLPILSFLAIPLVLIPLPWHWRARNIATLTIIITLFLLNLFTGVNSIIWAGTVVTKVPVWCDISTKFVVGATVSLPAASLCITKHLESVASVRQTMLTSGDKRRRTIFELCLCVLFPVIIMALHYVVQGHRFDIAEDFGCIPVVYWSWPSFLMITLPPLVLGFISMCYAVMAFRWFVLRRAQFAEHLRSCNSGLTTGRYMRLMALALTEAIICTSLGFYVMGVNLRDSKFRHWDNWAHVHSNFSRVAQLPRILVPEFVWNTMLMTKYMAPIGSLIFFIFFGFGQEAIAEYTRLWEGIRTKVLRLPPKAKNDSVLPTFSAPPRHASHPSSDNVTKIKNFDNLSIDEKWDDDDVMDSSSVSSKPDCSSLRQSTDDPCLSRPMSTPPPASTSVSAVSPRGRSLDLHREAGPIQ